jgi:hypothetical protein
MDRQTHFKLAACLVYWLTSWLHCQICTGQHAAALTSAANSPPKTIVLKDGGVLIGEVSGGGDRYLVMRAGSEIQVAAANVLFICDSLEEAYQLRRKKIDSPNAASHLHLADWCLRYNLVTAAARELSDARKLEPRHPRLALLERRLAAASRPQLQTARPASPAGDEVATSASTNKPSDSAMPIDALPAGAVERFTRKVQPILVNSCTTSGCHQPGGAQEFQLDRSLLHGPGNRRTTMQNLAWTLALIDRGQPHLSPLLTVPRETHGGMARPIFGPRQQSAFTHLVDWVALVSNSVAVGQEASSLNRAMKAAEDDKATMATVAEINSTEPIAVPLWPEADDLLGLPATIRYGAQLQIWQPKDPFDPEIFNRAHRSRLEKNNELEPHQIMPPHRSE